MFKICIFELQLYNCFSKTHKSEQRMKKIFTLAFSILSLATYAQQDPQFTHFFLNRLNYNPAFAGTEDKFCAVGIYRSQWIGFSGNENQLGVPIGANPNTGLLSINGPLSKKIGVGLNIYRDEQAFSNQLSAMGSFSYIHTFDNASKLSGGLGVGFIQRGIDGSNLVAKDQGDALVPTGNVVGQALDLNFGLYYTMPTLWRFNNFYSGYSMTHLNRPTVTMANNSESMVLHHYIMAGAAYDINSSFTLEPNIMIKRDRAKWSADINAMVMWNNKLRGGLTYRSEDAVSILLGYRINNDLQVGYSYDITTSNITQYSSGSHEIFLKYCFMLKTQPKEKIIIPRVTPRFL